MIDLQSSLRGPMSSAAVRLLALAAPLVVLACSRPLVIGDIAVSVEIETTVEGADHAPLEGVTVLFAEGSSSPVEVGRTDGSGFVTGRQTFLWPAPLGEPPPPITFTLLYRKHGYREVRHLFFAKDLPERNGFRYVASRVVLLRAGQGGAV